MLLKVYKLPMMQEQQVVAILLHTILAVLQVVAVAVAVLDLAVVLDLVDLADLAVVLVLDLLVAVTAADTKKPLQTKKYPEFFRGIFDSKGIFGLGGLYSKRVLQVLVHADSVSLHSMIQSK